MGKTMGNKHAMTRDEWKTVLKNQITSFYRSTIATKPREKSLPKRSPQAVGRSKTNPIGTFGRKPPVSKS